jgi:ketosteroid isomerase-like protein
MAFAGPIEDRLAIRELLETYSEAVCLVDADAWSATWAEDGVWELPDYPEIGKIVGRRNIVTAWKAAMAGYPGIVFVATPGSIVVRGDEATSTSYTSEVFNDKNGVTNRHRGRYEDVLVKRGGQWLFKSRRFKNIHKEP